MESWETSARGIDFQPVSLRDLVDALVDLAGVEDGLQLWQKKGDVLCHRKGRDQIELLKDHADAGRARLVRGRDGGGLPAKQDLA